MTEKLLVCSTFPPTRCGIAKYAAEHVLELKAQGNIVYTASVRQDGDADYRADFHSIKGIIKFAMLLLTKRFDGIHVHYATGFYFPNLHSKSLKIRIMRIMQFTLFHIIALHSGKHGSIIIHEAYTFKSSKYYSLKLGVCFSRFTKLIFHTKSEKDYTKNHFPIVMKDEKLIVEKHERYMRLNYFGSHIEAKNHLDLPKEKKIFLCIGFVHEHKNFEHAVHSFCQANLPESHLYIVGTIRLTNTNNINYKNKLISLVEKSEGVFFLDKFIDDDEFDCWLAASDAVILPYKRISSSGVAARCQLFGTDIIYNGQTNLTSQLADTSNVFPYYDDNRPLVEIMKELYK